MSTPQWQREWQSSITDPATLIDTLELDPALLEPAHQAARLFALRVPQAYLARMRPGDPHDPLLRQVLPLGTETEDTPGFTDDPVGDGASLHAGGVIHKYHGRALLIATGACAINCRYCFRRHFPYAEANASTGQWREALAYLRADPSIEEVILSGGDPLSLNDRRLSQLAEGLAAIPHLRRLRIHSRLPVVLPNRVDEALLDWLTGHHLQPVMVIHANHPNELGEDVAEAMQRLADRGVRLFNQAVLLRGVNDHADTLAELSERLFAIGVQPYYLHLLDRVQGAAHFEVSKAEATTLMRQITARLPGYLLPRLVREVPGEPSKTPIDCAMPRCAPQSADAT
ncbi:MAG: EF-P beta-lysylation protein EpmB [Spiribacter sp.]|nr:EF-P beta-lysylation protein EpmB [Spiribacter sp.]